MNNLVSTIKKQLKSPGRILHQINKQEGDYYCPICENSLRRFYPFGNPPRPFAQCPYCDSLERHRLDWIFLKQQTNLFENAEKSLLHVAPEASLAQKFKSIPNLNYLSVDLDSPHAMERMDITDIHYPDESFSSIYCSHVLEHIPDDRKAISELYRVLKTGGWAMLQVPISAQKTYEDFSITSPKERKKHFGYWNHVRKCGPDYINRMKDVGFQTKTIRANDFLAPSELNKLGIQGKRLIFYCCK
ncbi:class I SAM-dependent methyltransferase [Acaryochloris sp. IP29b_bin.148]|uniref:methyltransferase domain-containing protein n=1 Tax=Acaryochloris sp. IP29b_bin.148 TaxID=2969218 RepID=UPI0026240488|nr:class I SAM-dependent methyltransferase [Acaryochloris sp. IP29b_bin.148]